MTTKPTDIDEDKSWFDRFAGWANDAVSRAGFFVFCLLLVVLWAPSLPLFGSVDTWQLVINTITTIVTFLLVALTQNSQTRADRSTQHKLNAIAEALADLLEEQRGTEAEIAELRAAVGLENREST